MAQSGSHDNWQEAGADGFDQELLLALEIEIAGAHVPIWRRVVVPAEYPLDELHFIIALLFDWSGEAPYCFGCGTNVYEFPQGESVRIPLLDKPTARFFDSTLCTVADILPATDSIAVYYYDAGAAAREVWQLVVKRTGDLTGAEYPFSMIPVCVDGDGANPPEDVGGVDGFQDLCSDLQNEDSPNHRSACAWMCLDDPDDFDPRYFDLEQANYLLACDQVDAMADELIPKDPVKLRELARDLLAEEAVREATDIIRMSNLADKMSTPEGQRLLELILREAFPDEELFSGTVLASDPSSRDAAAPAAPAAPGPRAQASPRGRIIPLEYPAKPAAAKPAVVKSGSAKPTVAASPAGKSASRGVEPPADQMRLRDRVPQPNVHVERFAADMEAAGLAPKTREKHIANAEFFLNVYLPENAFTVVEGCYCMDDYFGFFLPQNCPWATLTFMRENITSVKKLYKFLAKEEVVSAADLAFLEESIAEYKDEWLAGF